MPANVIICIEHGLTMLHRLHGTSNVQQLANLLLLGAATSPPGRRHLPAARPIQRSRRPHRRHPGSRRTRS